MPGRLRTDLGGLYFNALIVAATMAVWWVTAYDAVLLVVATQLLQMLRQLLPLVRFDGYHVLADLTGVPDLFQRIGPILTGLVPWKQTDPRAAALKPWARAVVTTWVLVVVPTLLAVLVLLVLALPRIVGTALAAANGQRLEMLEAAGSGAVVDAVARGASMVIVLLPVLAFAYLFTRLGRQVGGAVWRRTEGRPVRRGLAILVALAVAAGLMWAWWPQEDRYRPVQRYEGGTLGDAVALARPATGFTVGSQGRGTVWLPEDSEPPSRERPQLATVLVPSGGGQATGAALEQGDVATADSETWVFPFDEPLAPDEGDNQALAINTTDGTVTYDVAFALVWADGEAPATNTNEAYAAASCERCAAVAVAFQVVLVVGSTDVAVPQNVSVAVNYECTSCLTYSLAVQLFVTLDGPLGEDARARMEELWTEITAYGENIGQVPLDQIQSQLTAYEQQILAIIEEDQGSLTEADPSASASESPSESTSESPSGSPSESPSGSPSPSSSESPSGSTSTSTSGSPTPSPSGSTSESPSGTGSPSASPSASGTTSASPSGASPSASTTP